MANLTIFPDDLRKKLEAEGLTSTDEVAVYLDDIGTNPTGNNNPFPQTDILRIRAILRTAPRQRQKTTFVAPLRPSLMIDYCPRCGIRFKGDLRFAYWDHLPKCSGREPKAEHLAMLNGSEVIRFCKITGLPITSQVVIDGFQLRIIQLTKGEPALSDLVDLINLPSEVRRRIPGFQDRMISALSGKSTKITARKPKKIQKRAIEFLTAVADLGAPDALMKECERLLADYSLNGDMTQAAIQSWRSRLASLNKMNELPVVQQEIESRPDHSASSFPEISISIDEELATALQSAANLFLQRVLQKAVFTPAGAFEARVPRSLTRRVGLNDIAINLITSGRDALETTVRIEGLEPIHFYWQAEAQWPEEKPQAALFIHAILSAIYHDLRVAGDETATRWKDQAEPAPWTTSSAQTATRPGQRPTVPHPARSHSTALLPRIPGEQDGHNASQVSRKPRGKDEIQVVWITGHLMLLSPGKKASQEALHRASLDGVLVPAGMTYVRPYIRGAGVIEPSGRKVVASGFNTLAAIFAEPARHRQ